MKNYRLIGFIFLFSCIFLNCSASRPLFQQHYEDKTVIYAEYDKVWDATLDALNAKDFQIVSSQKDSGTIKTESVKYYLSNCAKGMLTWSKLVKIFDEKMLIDGPIITGSG